MSEEKPEFVTNANVLPYDYEQFIGAGIHTLSPRAPGPDEGNGADKAVIQIEGKDGRYRDDGTPPTALLGIRLKASDPPFVYESDLSKFQVIETGGGVAFQMNVLYYRNKGSS